MPLYVSIAPNPIGQASTTGSCVIYAPLGVAGEKLRTKFNNLTQKHEGVDDKDRTSRDLRQACALLDNLQDPPGN